MKRTLPLLTLLLVLFSISQAYSQTKKLAILGSSTSACNDYGGNGGNYPIDSCYVNRLVKYYADQGITLSLYNLAVSGYWPFQAMPDRFHDSTYFAPFGNGEGDAYKTVDLDHNISKALAWGPDVVLLNFPSNGFDQMSVHDAMSMLRTIRNEALLAGIPVYVTTSQPRSSYNLPGRDSLKQVKDSILYEFGTTFNSKDFAIDFWSGLAVDDGSANRGNIVSTYAAIYDNIHLNPAGHAILAQRVVAADILGVNVPLPVKLTSFSASTKDLHPVLHWTADEESKGTKYLVQRSSDGRSFSTIAEVAGQNLAFNNKYEYTDADATGSVYYRLQIVEYDNKFYSETKHLKLDDPLSAFVIQKFFPVPASGNTLNLEVQAGKAQTFHIEVTSTLGVVLQSINQSVGSGVTNVPVSLMNLSKGMYFLKVSNTTSGSFIKKFTRN